MQGGSRGVSPVVGTVLLVAVVVVIAAVLGAFAFGIDTPQSRPPLAVVTVEETKLTDADISVEGPSDPGGCSADYGGEIGFEVELTRLDRADRILVLVTGETGTFRKTVWDSPTQADVGTKRLLANEVTTGPVDVDIGKDGSNDWATCPDESLTLDFYAEVDNEVYLLRKYRFG